MNPLHNAAHDQQTTLRVLPVGGADPHQEYAQLRQAGPVHHVTTPDGTRLWLVTREADVRSALTDPRLALNKRTASGNGYQGFSLPPALDANLLNLDPPDHTRLRRLVSQAFTAHRIDNLRGRIHTITDHLLDEIAARGHGDLIANFAAPLPLTVIGDLLGVPAASREQFRSWANILLAPQPGQPTQAKHAVESMHRYMIDLVHGKRRQPADDLLSALIAVRDAEDYLTEDELVSLAFLIFWAGHETSIDLIGNGLLALLRHPDQMAALRNQPDLVPAAVEEVLRYTTPNLLSIRRFATQEIEIGGVTIPAGETVILALVSANHDPARFPNPDHFDIHRDSNPHLAFGHGIHYCLGAPLARLEAHIALGAVLRRFPDLALTVAVEHLQWRPSWRGHGLLALPVAV